MADKDLSIEFVPLRPPTQLERVRQKQQIAELVWQGESLDELLLSFET